MMRRIGLLSVVLGLMVVASGSAATQPPLSQIVAKTRGSSAKPPPSRPCTGDCVVPSKYRTYEGFLRWSGDDVGRFWAASFAASQLRYVKARQLILGSAGVSSARTKCGVDPPRITTNSRVGPFYCSVDGSGTVYLPTEITRALVFDFAKDAALSDFRERDFAFSFIVAHEWGHHVQRLLGLDRAPSIRVELQADCLAGVWAYSAWSRSLLEPGDIQEGIRLAGSIGDRPGVRPNDPSAHGTPVQRMTWFMRGYNSGQGRMCDTRTVPVR